jgi:hypothetical protein
VHGWLKLMNEPMEPIEFYVLSLLHFDLKSQNINDIEVNLYRSKYLSLVAPPPEV